MSKNKKVAKKTKKVEQPSKNPLKRLGLYIKNSFLELRKTKFPNGKKTRAMLLSVLIYVAIILAVIWLLDIFFGWVFELILG